MRCGACRGARLADGEGPALQIPEDTIEALLDRWPVARLATCDPSGRPHQVPIVFARSGGELWSPVDGKPKLPRELARVRHVRLAPEVSLLLDDYGPDWSRLWWLRVDARARVVEAADIDAPEIGSAVAALREKYAQYEDTPVLRPPPMLLAFEIRGVASWRASAESLAEFAGA